MRYLSINRYVLPVVGIAIIAFTPVIAQACPVCVGSADELLSRGINRSILFMMAMPFSVAGVIAGALIYSMRRRARTSSDPDVRVTSGLDKEGE